MLSYWQKVMVQSIKGANVHVFFCKKQIIAAHFHSDWIIELITIYFKAFYTSLLVMPMYFNNLVFC